MKIDTIPAANARLGIYPHLKSDLCSVYVEVYGDTRVELNTVKCVLESQHVV